VWCVCVCVEVRGGVKGWGLRGGVEGRGEKRGRFGGWGLRFEV